MTGILSCETCEVRVVPWKVGDGSVKYMKCPNCLVIREPSEWKYKAFNQQPLGSVGSNSLLFDSQYTVIETKRGIRHSNTRAHGSSVRRKYDWNQDEKIPEFPFGPDKDLQFLVQDRPTVILNIVDDPQDNEDTIDDRYSD